MMPWKCCDMTLQASSLQHSHRRLPESSKKGSSFLTIKPPWGQLLHTDDVWCEICKCWRLGEKGLYSQQRTELGFQTTGRNRDTSLEDSSLLNFELILLEDGWNAKMAPYLDSNQSPCFIDSSDDFIKLFGDFTKLLKEKADFPQNMDLSIPWP